MTMLVLFINCFYALDPFFWEYDLSVCFHSCRWAEFCVTLLSSDGKWLSWLQLGLGSNHAMMHAIGLTLSSLYFNCILGSYLEKLLEACGLASSLV